MWSRNFSLGVLHHVPEMPNWTPEPAMSWLKRKNAGKHFLMEMGRSGILSVIQG